MPYRANDSRYDAMTYRRCGKSGLKLPAISLGITHFDLANNYGPSAGSAETTFGLVMDSDLRPYRDEMIVSTKAGYYMWPGPYGEWGSKKNLISSLDQSLQRMRLDYVDIFYHHRPDPDTPLEETAEALRQIVRSGKALYVGISNYSAEDTAKMVGVLREMGVRCLIHQMNYSMLRRENESVLDVLDDLEIGSISFSSLAQGLLTDRYLDGIPADSRAAGSSVFLGKDQVTPELIGKVKKLNSIAAERGQTLAEMALAWVLRRTTSVIIGASRLSQIADNVKAAEKLDFSPEELAAIDNALA
ncbi:MAG: aldo/keto reductase [Oscillospiraceae bacterium]